MLFNILLEIVMTRAADGVEHLGAVISGCIVSNLRFADDIVTLADSSNELQTIVKNIHREGRRMELSINAAKTETQCFSELKQDIRLSVNNVAVKQVDSFIYLGRKLTSSNSSSEDIVRHIGLAMGVVRSLQTIRKASSIATDRKLLLYRSLVLSTLLYNDETACL